MEISHLHWGHGSLSAAAAPTCTNLLMQMIPSPNFRAGKKAEARHYSWCDIQSYQQAQTEVTGSSSRPQYLLSFLALLLSSLISPSSGFSVFYDGDSTSSAARPLFYFPFI